MSVWTHVSGVIRLDDYSFIKGKRNTKKDIEEIIGPMCLFHNWNSKTKLPCGSEGSLQYSIYESDNEAEIARFTVMFWGDLRDYDNTDEIKKWFIELKKKFENKKNLICYRDAILKCKCEINDKDLILKLNDDTLKIEEVKND